jgi:hypothetical protein
MVGVGVRSRPLLGALSIEAGVRYLDYFATVQGVSDSPVRIGIGW